MDDVLLKTLAEQHKRLEQCVNEIDGALARADVLGLSQALSTMRRALVEHLALEDDEFYPGLKAMADQQGEKSAHEVVAAFQQSMNVISSGLLGFMARYEGKAFEIEAFGFDWNKTVQLLGQRIGAEEKTLAPIFKRLFNGIRRIA